MFLLAENPAKLRILTISGELSLTPVEYPIQIGPFDIPVPEESPLR